MAERPPGDNVLIQMFRTGQAVRELLVRALSGTGVTPEEFAVLSVIGLLGSASPTALAAWLRIPPTTVSRYVAGFVDSGLAARTPNPRDGRSYFLELTESGRDVMRTAAPRVRSAIEQLRELAPVDDIEAALVDLEQASAAVVFDSTASRQ
jgi:DNA-binding MarR family transcriptional regulator